MILAGWNGCYGCIAYKLDTDYININNKIEVDNFINDYIKNHKHYKVLKFKNNEEWKKYLDSYNI